MNDKEAPNDLVSPSDKEEKPKEGLVVPSAEKDKTTIEYIKTQKLTNTSNFISQL